MGGAAGEADAGVGTVRLPPLGDSQCKAAFIHIDQHLIREESMAGNRSTRSNRRPASNGEVELILRMIDGIHHRGERLESQDEQRVKLFLTLVSGSLALLAIAVQFGRLGVSDWPLVATGLLLFLIAYGFETLHSINWSRISIRENQAIEGFLLRRLASVNDVAAGIAEIQAEAEGFKKHAGLFRNTVRGNLVEFMYLTNGLLVTGMVLTLAKTNNWFLCLNPSATSAVFVTSIFLQYIYSHWVRQVIPIDWVKDPTTETASRLMRSK